MAELLNYILVSFVINSNVFLIIQVLFNLRIISLVFEIITKDSEQRLVLGISIKIPTGLVMIFELIIVIIIIILMILNIIERSYLILIINIVFYLIFEMNNILAKYRTKLSEL